MSDGTIKQSNSRIVEELRRERRLGDGGERELAKGVGGSGRGPGAAAACDSLGGPKDRELEADAVCTCGNGSVEAGERRLATVQRREEWDRLCWHCWARASMGLAEVRAKGSPHFCRRLTPMSRMAQAEPGLGSCAGKEQAGTTGEGGGR
jgi:hypothetical protein